jgi:hypothetical protein
VAAERNTQAFRWKQLAEEQGKTPRESVLNISGIDTWW